MKQDLYIVDVKVINAVETKEEETEMDGEAVIMHVKKSYTDQAVSFVLSKAVLLSKFKKLYIAPIEEAKKQGIVQ